MRSRDPCELLGLSRKASADEIRRAYRELVREYHPDANPDDPGAEERFKEPCQAYEALSNPTKGRNYNQRFGATSQKNCERPLARGGGPPGGSDTFQVVDLADLFVKRGGPSARRQEAERELRGEDVSHLTKLFRVDLDRPLEIAGRGRDDEGACDLRVRWTQRLRDPKADKMGQKPPKPPGTT